jgi:hypothetical protein
LSVGSTARVLNRSHRLFKSNVILYIYPQRDERSGRTLTLDDLEAPGPLRHLKTFLTETGRLEPIRTFDAGFLDIRAAAVRAQIESGDSAWESAVPPAVARTIKRDGLFGCQAPSWGKGDTAPSRATTPAVAAGAGRCREGRSPCRPRAVPHRSDLGRRFFAFWGERS